MSPRLLLLLIVPVSVILYAVIAPEIKRRFGLLGLIVVAYLMWAISGRILQHVYTAPLGERQGIGNLALVADLAGAIAFIIICVQVQRRPASNILGGAARALVIGTVLVSAVLLVGLLLLSQMAP